MRQGELSTYIGTFHLRIAVVLLVSKQHHTHELQYYLVCCAGAWRTCMNVYERGGTRRNMGETTQSWRIPRMHQNADVFPRAETRWCAYWMTVPA